MSTLLELVMLLWYFFFKLQVDEIHQQKGTARAVVTHIVLEIKNDRQLVPTRLCRMNLNSKTLNNTCLEKKLSRKFTARPRLPAVGEHSICK